MTKLHFDGQSLDVLPGETVLSCVERHGIPLASACRSGVCQSCMLRAVEGNVPALAQAGLDPSARAQGYLLACVCHPTTDLTLAPSQAPTMDSTVRRIEEMAPGIFGVWLERPAELDFRPGQFVHVVRPGDGLTRPYSLAGPAVADELELHVAVLPFGRMSRWLTASRGQSVLLRGPFGGCIYLDEDEESLLLAGTGTGLAPLLGVVRDALDRGHRGAIHLIHGARTTERLYRRGLLDAISARHGNLRVSYDVLERDTAPMDVLRAQSLQRSILTCARSGNPRVYLCGHPTFVHETKKKLYLGGTPLDRIHADPFVEAPPSQLH